jgi:hypothetical protein
MTGEDMLRQQGFAASPSDSPPSTPATPTISATEHHNENLRRLTAVDDNDTA